MKFRDLPLNSSLLIIVFGPKFFYRTPQSHLHPSTLLGSGEVIKGLIDVLEE